MKPSINLLHATALVAGIIIGASIFVQPSEINRHVPSVAGVLSVWIVAGVVTVFGALICAELSSAMPRNGGVYVFLKETLSPACGFLWGWAMFWSAHSGIIAASSVIFARYVAPSVYLKQFYYDTVNFDARSLELAIAFAGADRILAGSDYPHQIGSIPKMLESVRGLAVSEEDRVKIFGGNADRLLGGS